MNDITGFQQLETEKVIRKTDRSKKKNINEALLNSISDFRTIAKTFR